MEFFRVNEQRKIGVVVSSMCGTRTWDGISHRLHTYVACKPLMAFGDDYQSFIDLFSVLK